MNLSEVKSEAGALTVVAAPAVLSQLAQMSFGFIDTLMAGRYSPEALAAVAVGSNLVMPVVVFFMGLFIAMTPMIAQLNGKGETARIGRIFQLGFFAALLFAPLMFVILRNFVPLMEWLGIQPEIIPIVDDYLKAISWGSFSIFGFLALRSANEGLFATKPVMICSLLAIPFNILFNYWFVYGGLGVQAMGAVGVGYATAITWTLLLLLLGGYTLLKRSYASMQIFTNWHWPKTDTWAEFFKIGLPLGANLGMEVLMFALVGLFIGTYTIELIAAHQIALNLASIAFMIPMGISIGITARVGYAAGTGSRHQVKVAGYTGIAICTLIQVVSATIMLTLAVQLAGFYTKDLAIVTLAAELLVLAAMFQFSDGFQVAASGALRGLKDTTIPMMISFVAYWIIGFPLGHYLANSQGMLARGYWIGIIAGLTAAAIMLFWRFYKISQIKVDVSADEIYPPIH